MLKYSQFILESVGGKKIALFIGRFQPVHLGHLASMKKTSEQLGCPVIAIQIISKTDKSPFDKNLLEKIGNEIKKEYSFIEDFIILPPDIKNVIPQIVKFLQGKGYDPIGLGCGSDRVKDYQRQSDYLNSEKSDVKVNEFKIAMVNSREGDSFSGTKVRESIKSGNIKLFKEMTPHGIHKFYNELKQKLN